MQLFLRVEQILQALRPAFRRQAAFNWFVLLLWGILLSTQPAAITSYLNAIGLGEAYYHQALHWFRSSAWSIAELSECWETWLRGHAKVHHLNGHPVYVGDGIKVGKEGRKMPGVKRLHQESANVSKSEWIRGHYFGALALLMGTKDALFAVPVAIELQDGIRMDEPESLSLVDKMARLGGRLLPSGAYLLLDAYFAAANLLGPLRAQNIHVITRMRSSSVAYQPVAVTPGPRQRGRPRKWGEKVKLNELFAQVQPLEGGPLSLYGKKVTPNVFSIQLHWDCPKNLVQFVLAQWPDGKQLILLSTDVSLSARDVIEAYSWRFKIEVSFRALVQLLGAFCYRFWLKRLSKTPHWPETLDLKSHSKEFGQEVERVVEAFERFVTVHGIALGILQVLSLEMADSIWILFPRWFRTLPNHGYPSEQIVRLTLHHCGERILRRSASGLLLHQFLNEKKRSAQTRLRQPLVA
jgi:hypothetical protein